MSKGFLAVIAAIIIIFVGIFVLGSGKSGAPAKSSSASLTQHLEGKGASGVTLVEYGDYQCPFCGQAFPIVKQVESDLNDQIKFQFRNFPLQSLHPNAFAGARAAEAADLQNKFWEMHDILYENQDPNGASGWVTAHDPLNQYFVGFAKQLGLNVDKFKQDFASSTVNDRINADMAEGNKLNITGTPTFYLDGKKVNANDTTTVDSFEKVIKAEIAKKQPAQTQATQPAQ